MVDYKIFFYCWLLKIFPLPYDICVLLMIVHFYLQGLTLTKNAHLLEMCQLGAASWQEHAIVPR